MKKIFLLLTLILLSSAAIAGDFENGVQAYQSGNYRYAEYYFKNVLSENPYNDSAKYYLAITLVQNRKTADAKILYKNIIQTSDDPEIINLARSGLKLLGEMPAKTAATPSKITKAVININTKGNVIILNNVNINDRARVKFIFDTGASYTTISTALAKQLGISTANLDTIKIQTASGYINAPKIILRKIEINGITAHNVEAIIADLPLHSSGNAGNLAGLLGLSFMKDFKVTVDRKNNHIILEK
jgi:clan AA aspartic protease (TIGR02281 family)